MDGAFKHTVRADSGESLSLSVTYAGHQKCEPSQRWGKGVREQFILHVIVSGRGTFVTSGGSFCLGPGDAFLIRPHTETEYFADCDDPWEYYWVNFSGPDAELLIGKTLFTEENPVIRNCGENIVNAMEDILSCPGKNPSECAELTGRLYLLLSGLIPHNVRTTGGGGKKRIRLNAAKAFIETNYSFPISADDIAEAAGITRITLFRLFRTELGVTPAEYLIRCRISRAKGLLSSTDLSVSAVAVSSGYEDPMYFSRAFRKETGMSPTEYRMLQKSI